MDSSFTAASVAQEAPDTGDLSAHSMETASAMSLPPSVTLAQAGS